MAVGPAASPRSTHPTLDQGVDHVTQAEEADLEAAYERWREHDPHLADVLLVLGWTGMRWGEARAVLVEDVVEVPTAGLLVRRSQTEGGAVKAGAGAGCRWPIGSCRSSVG